jgi:hypothetical protein
MVDESIIAIEKVYNNIRAGEIGPVNPAELPAITGQCYRVAANKKFFNAIHVGHYISTSIH